MDTIQSATQLAAALYGRRPAVPSRAGFDRRYSADSADIT